MTLVDTVRAARLHSRRTQAQTVAGTQISQGGLSSWERGHRQLSSSLADQLAMRLNIRHGVVDGNLLSVVQASALIAAALAEGREEDGLVHLGQLGRHLEIASAIDRAVLCSAPPLPTADEHFDAALAAVAEYRLAEVGIPAPPWAIAVAEPDQRSLGALWSAADLAATPQVMLAHGVVLPLAAISGVPDGLL